MRAALGAVRGIWKLFRLTLVAFAWGVPFVLLLYVVIASDPASYSPVRQIINVAIPVFAIAGIIIVAWPIQETGALSNMPGVAILALGATGMMLGGVAISSYMNEALFDVFFPPAFLLSLLGPFLGTMVTASTLWRRRHWYAKVWLIGYVCVLSVALWGATQALMKEESGFGPGLLLFIVPTLLLQVSIYGSALALLVTWLFKKASGSQDNATA